MAEIESLVPDYPGWEGRQSITLKEGTKLSIGFSDVIGTSKIEIFVRAIRNADL